jgi:hypothetical protein
MKRDFLSTPDLWVRASRTYVTPADYASAVERFQRKGHGAVTWIGGVICVVIVGLLFAGRL